MKKLIFLLIITSWSPFLAAQTIFCEAQALAANETYFLQEVERIQQEKALLLQKYQNSASPYANFLRWQIMIIEQGNPFPFFSYY